MSETKKRPHAEDAEHVRPKKRAMSDEHGSPGQVNGVVSPADEPKDGDSLELFRKDAIYRRMKYYSRECERKAARVAELERRRSTCEAGLAALEACWTQIIGTIRLLVKAEDLPPADVSTEELFDLTSHVSDDPDPDYLDALRHKMHATSELVGAFVRLGGQVQVSCTKDEMYQKCQKAQTECSSLRSELSLTRAKLRDVEAERDKYHEDLAAAEKRLDRLQSRTVGNLQGLSVKVETKVESPLETPASPASEQSIPNGIHSGDVDEWQGVASHRETVITRLQSENIQLRDEIDRMHSELKAPSEEFITQSAYYKVLLEHGSRLEHSTSEKQNEISRLKEEVEQLQSSRQEFEAATIAANEQAVQELKIMLTKRDNENSRLREQRDQQLSELNERKQKEHIKIQSIHEQKNLAESRLERIQVLELEITRLKTRLAANVGDEDLMSFLSKDRGEDLQAYVDDLRARLSAADARADALEASLSLLRQEHPDIARHVKSEAEVRERLTEVQKQLERYQSVYGDTSSAIPPEIEKLAVQLQSKEDEIRRLLLQEKQRHQAEQPLYAELDKLSAAWETLDRQVKSKVFDLTAMEEKLTKSGLDKAKSDNKFYAAMRDKEAIETERKNTARKLEKLGRVVERLTEAENSLTAQISDKEKEMSVWKKMADVQKDRITAMECEIAELKLRAEGDRKRAEEMHVHMREYMHAVDRKREDLRKLEEGLVRKQKEAERHTAKMKAMAQTHSTSASSREAQLQSEVDKCMSILKCSTCKQNMRNTVITKCMHSFCKSCVESRIATRQRKCPACNLPFSQGEVQQLFFQ